jgi:hypothetical protein
MSDERVEVCNPEPINIGVCSDSPEPINIKVCGGPPGPVGPPGPPAEIYVQQTQPAPPQNVGAIWYQTDANGQVEKQHVWDGIQWLLTGITSIVPVSPITASGSSTVTVGIDTATETTPGAVARLATVADVANVTAGPVVDSQLLAMMLATTVPEKTSDLTNDGDGVGGPYVDAAGASLAAPIQSLIAGNDIHISNVGKDFIISAVPNPEHQSDWLVVDTGNPAFIRNKPVNVSQFANDAGYITVAESVAAAPVQSVNGMTGAVVIDLSPYATNEDLNATNAKFADYLPLSGGSISGALTVAGAFNVGPAGSARVPTPGATDVSTAVATTEWVQTLLAATGAIRFMWRYDGFDVYTDPGMGNLTISNGNTIIAMSKTDGHGNQRYLAPISPGDSIVLTDNPATGPATEYQRFDVTGSPTDNGGWVSIPVSLAGGTSPIWATGEEVRVAIGLDSQAATIDGVSAGYGLIGGGISGVVSLAIDTSVVAELSDLPTATGDLTNTGNGTGGPYVDATEASAAAPVQSIIAGTDIAVVPSGKDFTISFSNDTGYITASAIPTNVSAFTNDAGYITLADVPASAQADWNETDTQSPAYILNKPTTVSAFTNDAGYVTQSAIDTTVADYLPLAGGTMTGSIVIPDGTAAAPSLKFDDATGIYQPAANTWAVSTGGVERLRVLANGHVAMSQSAKVSATSPSAAENGLTIRHDHADNSQMISAYGYAPDDTVKNIYGVWSQLGSTATAGTHHAGVWACFFAGATAAGSGTVVDEIRCFSAADQVVPTDAHAFHSTMAQRPGKTRYALYLAGNAPSYVNGQIQTTIGAVAAPAVAYFGDEDTGTFSPGANTWAVSTGGVERLRVRSDGNVGIGGSGGGTSKVAVQGLVSGSGAIFGVNNIMQGQCDNGIIYAYAAAPSITGTPANVYCYAVGTLGSTVANADRVVGFRVDATAWSATAKDGNYGVWATVNSESGKTNYAIFATGTAPSYFGGQLQTGLGTASAPSVAYSGDEDTGTFSAGADTWAVSTGGVERLRVRADGNVGIGASGDSATRLKIAGTTASYGVRMDVGASASSSTYDGILVVSSSVGGSVTGSSSGLRIAGSGAICDNFRGVNVTSVPASTTNLCIGVSASVSAGNNRWAFYSDGGADSYSSGNWQFAAGKGVESATGQASTQFPDNDKFAISAGGTERLRVQATGDLLAATGYTPANDQSLATKKYVDARIVFCTQAEYDNLTPDPSVLYCITG